MKSSGAIPESLHPSNSKIKGLNPHEVYMDAALEEAKLALREREVPIGAVVVQGEGIIGRGHNQVEQAGDPTAHAEILAIRQAGLSLKDWRLSGCMIYVTVEPCVMCLGAILLARISELIYALREPKTGAIRSTIGFFGSWAGRNLPVTEGVRRSESLLLLQNFFDKVRNKDIKERYRSLAVTGSTRNRLVL